MKLKVLFAINFVLLGTVLSVLFLSPYIYSYIINSLVLVSIFLLGLKPSVIIEVFIKLLGSLLFFGPIILFGYVGHMIGERREKEYVNKEELDLLKMKYLVLTMLVFAVSAVVVFLSVANNGFSLY